MERADEGPVDGDLSDDPARPNVVDERSPAADGVANGRVREELAGNAPQAAAGAGDELDPALGGDVEDAEVVARDGLVGGNERVVHVDEDQLDHGALPSRRSSRHDSAPASARRNVFAEKNAE